MTNAEKIAEGLQQVNDMARAAERLRVASWLLDRCELLMKAGLAEEAHELCLCATAIKDNKLEPKS
jgi:hypothetical protein